MSKAYVGRANHAVFSDKASGIPDRYEVGWGATHECGWWEWLTTWHGAFWAADHHVRYDCGRREQPSSGAYDVGLGGVRRTVSAGFAGGEVPLWINEGGAQKDPTPSPVEDATVELGAITTELEVGGIEWGGRQLEGYSEGASGGSAGWWARVRGRAR